MITLPLKTEFKVDEDLGYVPDQIKERVNSESNYEWSRTPTPLSPAERIEYSKQLSTNYNLYKANKIIKSRMMII